MTRGEREGAQREVMLALGQLRGTLERLHGAVQGIGVGEVVSERVQARRYREALVSVHSVLGACEAGEGVRRAALAAWMIADEALHDDPEVRDGDVHGVGAGVQRGGTDGAGDVAGCGEGAGAAAAAVGQAGAAADA